jgi:Flp pilus assembly protein TadD
MAGTGVKAAMGGLRRSNGLLTLVGCCLTLAACSKPDQSLSDMLAAQKPAEQKTAAAEPAVSKITTGATTPASTNPAATTPGVTTPATTTPATDGKAELAKATEYWGKVYAKSPKDAQTALNFARNLKAQGEKQQALAVLQQASAANPTHKGIAGDYGRLLLEFNHITQADKVLELADDPSNPDWKVVSARGTVFAKQSQYSKAVPLFERALQLAPDQPSVMSNLALAYAMEGKVDKAEPLLRKAAALGGDARVNQNLALVLGLQGKYDEAKLAMANDVPPDRAAANVEYLRQMVKAEPKPMPKAEAPDKVAAQLKPAAVQDAKATPGWSSSVAVAKPAN